MMNLIHYNNFADHIKNTYKSDCTIYLENNGQMGTDGLERRFQIN